MHRRPTRTRERALLTTGVRAAVALVQLVWLLDVGLAGPAGPAVAAWLLASVVAVALVAVRGEPWPPTEAVVVAVDAVAVAALTATAPGGYAAVALLALVVLVQVPLRFGVGPALLVGAGLTAAGVLHPSTGPLSLGSGATLAVFNGSVVVLALAVRRALAHRERLDHDGATTSALSFEHSLDGAAMTDAAGVLRGVNPTLARWCTSTPDDMVGRSLADLVDPRDAGALAVALDPDPAARTDAEVRLAVPGGGRWVRLLVAHVPADAARPALCAVQVEDASTHRATTARLAHDATHDPMTGLPNRRAMSGELAALLSAPGRGGALLMVDLDDFKAVNDRLGHAAGDELLQVVADRLRSCLRPGDVAGRLGGDEMLVIARGVADDESAEAVGHRVLATLVGPASLRAGAVVVRASMGVRRVTAADGDGLAAVRDADAALYRAKADGGCCARRAEAGEADAGRGGGGPHPPLAPAARRPGARVA